MVSAIRKLNIFIGLFRYLNRICLVLPSLEYGSKYSSACMIQEFPIENLFCFKRLRTSQANKIKGKQLRTLICTHQAPPSQTSFTCF
jgi:hypothetical protein